MPRRKKTQHIGHDPLAWLAENDTPNTEDTASAVDAEEEAVEATEASDTTGDVEPVTVETVVATEAAEAEVEAQSAEADDDADMTDDRPMQADNIDEAETTIVESAEVVEAGTDSELLAADASEEAETVTNDNNDAEPIVIIEAEQTDDTAEIEASTSTELTPEEDALVIIDAEDDDLTASSDLETDSAASLVTLGAIDEEAEDEAEQQTFAAYTLVADAEQTAEAEFSDADADSALDIDATDETADSLLAGWTAVNLPPVLTLTELSDLYQQLRELRGQRIRLSGEQVSRVDTASLQLLVTLMRDEETTVGWTNVSPVLCNSARVLGLAGELSLMGCELEVE